MADLRPLTTITLPSSRAQQLHELARNADDGKGGKGITVSELIDRIVNRAIADGELPDSTPGCLIWSNDHHLVCATLGEIMLPVMLPAVARDLASAILSHLSPPSKATAFKLGRSLLGIKRSGKGIVITHLKNPGAAPAKFTTTPGIGRDLARQLDKAADEAEIHVV